MASEQAEEKVDGKRGFFARWHQRRMVRRVKRISRRLELDASQEAELTRIFFGMQAARRKLYHAFGDTRRQLASILRDPETHAEALKTEIDLGMETLEEELNQLSEQLVTLVAPMTHQQRNRLADLVTPRTHCAYSHTVAH